MFKTRTLGERTRDTVQEGLCIGRDAMERAVGRGQEVWNRLSRPEPTYNGNGWLWFAGGLTAALALIVGWRRAGALSWQGRYVEDVMVRNVQTIDAQMNLTQ